MAITPDLDSLGLVFLLSATAVSLSSIALNPEPDEENKEYLKFLILGYVMV